MHVEPGSRKEVKAILNRRVYIHINVKLASREGFEVYL